MGTCLSLTRFSCRQHARLDFFQHLSSSASSVQVQCVETKLPLPALFRQASTTATQVYFHKVCFVAGELSGYEFRGSPIYRGRGLAAPEEPLEPARAKTRGCTGCHVRRRARHVVMPWFHTFMVAVVFRLLATAALLLPGRVVWFLVQMWSRLLFPQRRYVDTVPSAAALPLQRFQSSPIIEWEWSVPVSKTQPALHAVATLLANPKYFAPRVVEATFTASDSVWLSPFFKENCCTINVRVLCTACLCVSPSLCHLPPIHHPGCFYRSEAPSPFGCTAERALRTEPSCTPCLSSWRRWVAGRRFRHSCCSARLPCGRLVWVITDA